MLAQRPSFRYLASGAAVSLLLITFLVYGVRSGSGVGYILKSSRPAVGSCSSSEPSTTPAENWTFEVNRDALNYGLSEGQCLTAFPKLFNESDRSAFMRKDNPFTYKDLDSRNVEDGMVRGIIDQGQLYIVDFAPQPVTASRARATLNSLNRALEAYPDRRSLPNVEFIFTSEDFANDPAGRGPIWAYSKRDSDTSVWLMPDFGYWAWPEVKIGPYHEVRRRIAAIDDGEITQDGTEVPGLNFVDKKKQLVWRGSLNTNPAVRSKLLKSAAGHSWASVRVIDWDDENDIRYNLLPIEDHCRYMFLGHTEGRSFSGRGKYLLNCRSVVFSHPLEWREAHHAALIASGPEANYIQVAHDFGDLPEKVDFLIDNPLIAEHIANNAVRTFRDRYLTPAAESCYWRYLITRYASACEFEPVLFTEDLDGKKSPRGVPFETWLLTH